MLDELYNFLFARGALQKAASAPGTPTNKKKTPEDNVNPGTGVTQMDIGKMAQEQADRVLREKLAKQRAARGPNFMGPQQ